MEYNFGSIFLPWPGLENGAIRSHFRKKKTKTGRVESDRMAGHNVADNHFYSVSALAESGLNFLDRALG